MKSFPIKKCIIGFTVAIISIFVFNADVKAFTLNDGTSVPELPTGSNTTPYYVITENGEGEITLIYHVSNNVTTIDGKYPSLIISDIDGGEATMSYLDWGGFWITGTFKKEVHGYKLKNNKWEYQGYKDSGFGSGTPFADFDENLFYRDRDNPLVQEYYQRYIKYISFYCYKKYFDIETKKHVVYYAVGRENNDLDKKYLKVTHGLASDLLGREVNVVQLDVIENYDNSLIYQYSYDNKNFYTIPFSEDNKLHYLNHGIQTFLYFRVLSQDGSIVWTYEYNEIFEGNVIDINVKERIACDSSGNTIILAIVDFTEFDQFNDIYNLTYKINGIEVSPMEMYEINRYNYEYFNEIAIEVYIDEYLVNAVCYSPHYSGFELFDEKVKDIIEKQNQEESEYIEVTVENLKEILIDYWEVNESEQRIVKQVLKIFFDEMSNELYLSLVVILFVLFICTILFVAGWK